MPGTNAISDSSGLVIGALPCTWSETGQINHKKGSTKMQDQTPDSFELVRLRAMREDYATWRIDRMVEHHVRKAPTNPDHYPCWGLWWNALVSRLAGGSVGPGRRDAVGTSGGFRWEEVLAFFTVDDYQTSDETEAFLSSPEVGRALAGYWKRHLQEGCPCPRDDPTHEHQAADDAWDDL
jgi:hypothetical protein